ncbi:MAG: hypothetical protein V4616_12935, partial [Bacteroidota bacterium]
VEAIKPSIDATISINKLTEDKKQKGLLGRIFSKGDKKDDGDQKESKKEKKADKPKAKKEKKADKPKRRAQSPI